MYLRFFEIRSSEVEKSPFLSRNRLILPAKIAFYGSKIALRQRESVFLSRFLDFYGFQRLIFVSDKGICQQNQDKMLCGEAIFIYPDGWRRGCISFSQNFSDAINLKIHEMRLKMKVEFDFVWLKNFALTNFIFCNGWKTRRKWAWIDFFGR